MFDPYRGCRSLTTETGGARFLGPGVHVSLVVVDHPGNIEIFAQGIIEGTVADIVNGAVTGKNDDLGQYIIETVMICLVHTEFGPQSSSRCRTETVVTRLVDSGVERIDQFGNLVAACGIDRVDAEPSVDHVIYGMPVYIR